MTDTDPQYDSFKQVILEYLQGKKYEPLSEKSLFSKLKIPAKFQEICRQILKDLVDEGIILVKRKQFHLNKPAREILSGVIRMHAKGFGFVVLDHPGAYTQDIFIPKHLTENAVDGDKVEVEVDLDSTSAKGPEGKIIGILERARTHVGATLHHFETPKRVYAYSPLMGTTKMIATVPRKQSVVGDRVILKITDWGDENGPPHGEIAHYLGSINDPSIDINSAIEEFDLHNVFTPEAMKQALPLGTEVSKDDLKKRTDFSTLVTVTIDPETAKDFDDALSLTVDSKGAYHLGVHIADVSHYVPRGTPLDIEAKERANSTYFPGRCLPMLPHELSDQLCSLNPDVIRLTVSVMMDFDAQGNLLKTEIVRSYIKSAKRFSYEEAKDVLDSKTPSPHKDLLERMVKLCLLLKEKRAERGSIDFSLTELLVIVDDKGVPQKTHKVEYDITHQLVEEFMLKANEMVARHLADKGKHAVFRIHEEPSPTDKEEFYGMARALGFTLPKEPTKQDVQALFEKAKATPHAHQLAIGFIRSMKLAYYSTENVGHYGLSLDHYCHFTSPIRRYTDLIIHRLLFDEEGEHTDIEEIAKHCSERERISFKAESSVKILKKFRLLHKWLQEDPHAVYDATVTRVKPFGLYFDLSHLMLEGFLHISDLENDYFVFNPTQDTLFGRASGRVHKVGEVLKVRPASLDLVLLEAKWELVLPKNSQRTKRPKRGPR
jgi:ribonuclease R